ncbi:MAG: phosphodiesterase [Chloroflexi bacterium]|nr:phosphodiesterase [Chloroflexota bacterium]
MIIAQISDPHITTIETDESAANLQRAVDHLMQLPTLPDVVLVTGDCADTGSRAEYERLQILLSPLTMPVYVIPGNHDDRAVMLQMFGAQGQQPLDGFVQYVVDREPLRLIALDTNVPGRGEGALCTERLAWLEARLAEAPTRPTILFLHHPPFLTGLAPLDKIRLLDADALGAIIARSPQVERIVAGHVHVPMLRRFHGTIAMSCPATASSLLPDLNQPQRLAVRLETPACLLHVWNDSTGLLTYTSVIGAHGPVVELHDGEKWLG